MKKVFNFHWIFCMTFWCVATLCCVFGIIAYPTLINDVLYAAAVLMVLFFALLFRPVRVDFDRESLTIHYLFGFYEKMKWETIWKIERQEIPEDIRYYEVFGDSFGKTAFFTSTKIPYSRKVKKLLREYWKKEFGQ